jgi:hypothetical protein
MTILQFSLFNLHGAMTMTGFLPESGREPREIFDTNVYAVENIFLIAL